LLRQAMPEDFIKFGLIPEFIGRVPIVVTLDELDEEALVRILLEPKNSLVKQYKKLLELDGVQLGFDDDALLAIAKQALSRKTGARGLRSIMEKTMMDVMYETPSDDTIHACQITKSAVEGSEQPILVRGDAKPPVQQQGRARTKVSHDRIGGPASA